MEKANTMPAYRPEKLKKKKKKESDNTIRKIQYLDDVHSF